MMIFASRRCRAHLSPHGGRGQGGGEILSWESYGRTAGVSTGMPARATSDRAPARPVPARRRIRLGADAGDAAAQPALQRAERLPFQAILRIAGGMARVIAEPARRLSQLSSWQLAQARLSWPCRCMNSRGRWRRKRELRSASARPACRATARRRRRSAPAIRGSHRQRRGLLMPGAAQIDALLQIDRPASAASKSG